MSGARNSMPTTTGGGTMPETTNELRPRPRAVDDGWPLFRVQQGRQPDRGRLHHPGAPGRLPAPPPRRGADGDRTVRPQRTTEMPRARHQPRPLPTSSASPRETLTTNPNATSELYHVIRGRGRTGVHGQEIPWEKGDFFVLPAGSGRRITPRTMRRSTGSMTSRSCATGCQGHRAPVRADALPEGPGPRRTPQGGRGPGGQRRAA